MLSQSGVIKRRCHAGWQVLLLLLRFTTLILHSLALPFAAFVHFFVGFVALFDRQVDGLLLQGDSIVIGSPNHGVLLEDTNESRDKSRVKNGANGQAPFHMVTVTTMMALTTMTALATFASMAAVLAILAMLAILTLAVLALSMLAFTTLVTSFKLGLFVIIVVPVKVTAAVALVNGGLRDIGQIERLNVLEHCWEEFLIDFIEVLGTHVLSTIL